MIGHFDVASVSGERLLDSWKWLCSSDFNLVAERVAFFEKVS